MYSTGTGCACTIFFKKRGEFMTTIEYLSLPVHKRVLYKTLSALCSIPRAIWNFLSVTLIGFFTSIGKKIARYFINIVDVFKGGDWKTRTSFFLMGYGHITRKSLVKGLMYLIYQAMF
jgi:hypothetical protein